MSGTPLGLPLSPAIASIPFVDPGSGRLSLAAVAFLTAIINAIQGTGGALSVLADVLFDKTGAALDQSQLAQVLAQAALAAAPAAPVPEGALLLPPAPLPAGCVPCVQFDSGTLISTGIGAPDSAVYGSVTDIFLQRDGAAGSVMWVKTSGTNTSTGWTAIA